MIRNLCKFNFTYVIPEYKFDNMLSVDESTGQMKGKLSSSLFHVLGKEKSCRLIGSNGVGKVFKNKTHTGAFKLLYDKKGDFILLPQPFYFVSEKIDFSYIVTPERYVVTHPIGTSTFSNSDQDLLNVLNLDQRYFFSYIGLNIFVYFFLFLQIKKVLSNNFKSSNFLECLGFTLKLTEKSMDNGFLNYNFFKIKFFGLIVFTIYILTYFTKNFITNSLKTSKVVVDTNMIIDNEDRLFLSKKFICWLFSEPSLAFAKVSPEGTLLQKIYRFKHKNNCFFKSSGFDYATIQKFQSNGFFICAYFFSIVLVTALINFRKQYFWVSDSFYELNLSYLLRRSLETEKKRFLKDIVLVHFESGIHSHVYKVSINSILTNEKLKFIFESLENFKNHHTKFVAINLGFLRSSFSILLLIYCVLILIFTVSALIKFFRTKKNQV